MQVYPLVRLDPLEMFNMKNDYKPLVTVVIPCYNHEGHVGACITSVIEQTYDNIELIIIDDGSKDGSVAQIEALSALCLQRFSNFKFITRENRGLCNTLNEALDIAEGHYFCAIASDDALLPSKINTQVAYLESNPKCGAVFGGIRIVSEDGAFIRDRHTTKGKFEFSDILLVKHSFATPSQLIRMEALRAAGPYDPAIYIEDWYMWLKIAMNGYTLDDLGGIVSMYRRHGSNMSSNLTKMAVARRAVLNMYKDHPLYRAAASRLMLTYAIDIQLHSKLQSLMMIARNIRMLPFLFRDRRFYVFWMKFLIPANLMKQRNGVES